MMKAGVGVGRHLRTNLALCLKGLTSGIVKLIAIKRSNMTREP